MQTPLSQALFVGQRSRRGQRDIFAFQRPDPERQPIQRNRIGLGHTKGEFVVSRDALKFDQMTVNMFHRWNSVDELVVEDPGKLD